MTMKKLLTFLAVLVTGLAIASGASATQYLTAKNTDGTLCTSGCTWHTLVQGQQHDVATGQNQGYQAYPCGFQYPNQGATCPLIFNANAWTGFWDTVLNVPISSWITKPCPTGGGYLYSNTKYWNTFGNATAYWTTQQLVPGCKTVAPPGIPVRP